MLHLQSDYSVVVPSLGRWDYLKELLDSIGRQSILPKEVFVILDAYETYAEVDLIDFHNYIELAEPPVHIIYIQENLAQKRNSGVTLCTTPNIFFSDDDDIWSPEKAKICLAELRKYPVVTHNFGKFGDCVKTQCSQLGHNDRTIKLTVNLPGDNVYGGGSSIIAKKSLLLEIPFRTSLPYCEDLDWWLSVLGSDKIIKYIGMDLVIYRSHHTNMTNRNLSIYFYTMLVIRHQATKSFTMCVLCMKIFFRTTAKFIYKFVRA